VVAYQGRWKITVVAKDSAWDQRVVISGATQGGGVVPGVIGSSQTVDGDHWQLTIEHNDGSGWSENASVVPDPLQQNGADLRQVVRSKDQFHPGDTDPNDLVIEVEKVGPLFAMTVRPYAVDGETLQLHADGVFVALDGVQLMGVEIENTWGAPFIGAVLDVSDLGRATLASFGLVVVDAWTGVALRATGQQLVGRAVALPQIDVGERHTVYFQVDARGARRGKPDVELVLLDRLHTPDPDQPNRRASRAAFVADVGYDPATGRAFARIPEGTLTLTLQSMAVDARAVTRLCRRVRSPARNDPDWRELRAALERGHCDARTLRRLLALLCHCAGDGDGKDDGRSWERACLPGGVWLPLRFEYGVEVAGGFTGQHGPLAFQDPWWKVVLLIIAALAWLVGLIASIVADKTGWGNEGDFPRRIGTVGASNRTTTDACIIELDGSRPALQRVADAIPGEPNNQPIVGLGTTIPIDPQVAFTSLASPDVVGKHVYKSGSRTGLTHGIITSIGPFIQSRSDNGPDPNHPDLHLASQFRIDPDPAFGEELFDDHGDSGSIVLSRETDSMHRVVGLLHSSSGGTSPIQDVLAALDLKLS